MSAAGATPQATLGSALNPGVRPREVFAWAMYDFANSGYTTVVLTAVFNAYFVGAVAGNADWATLAWTTTLALSSLAVMLTMPAIGAYADARGSKKRLLAVSTLACIASTAALAWVQPGMVGAAVLLVIVSNYCFSVGESLNAAFLPELARGDALGRVSGWGWSLGYFGGMLALGLSLAVVISGRSRGLSAADYVPLTMLITAAVFALAAIPAFVFLHERASPAAGPMTSGESASPAIGSLARLRRTWQQAQRFRDFRRLLACGCAYQAGITVVITLAAVYAEQAMKFTTEQTMALIFVVNIASAIGAFGFGYLEDRLGHRRALGVTLVGWIVMTVLASASTSMITFWIAAALAGLCMGSSQSCGRAMAGALSPADRRAEFFGLWTFATRLAAIIGPMTYGVVTWLTGNNHRLAILATGIFFVIGLVILQGIDMKRGERAAQAG